MKRPTQARVKLAAKQVGENLSAWRKMRNLTMQQLADKANVSRATISRLENGDPSVSMETLLSVCSIIGILDRTLDAVDPYETDYGRLRADETLPQRVRR